MRVRWGVALLAVVAAACGDPDTSDERGYTKAPLENPGLLVDAEPATAMGELNRPDRPRPVPVAEQGPEQPADPAEEGAGDEQVALAEGVTQAQFDQGRELFSGQAGCTACHGPDAGGGQLAPDLTDREWLHVTEPTVDAIAEVIRAGVPQPVQSPAPMPPMGGASLDAEQVEALAAYVASLGTGGA